MKTVVLPSGEQVPAFGLGAWNIGDRRADRGEEIATLRLGLDLGAMKMIVVKSSQHFYASFSKVAKHVIYVGAPGVVTTDLKSLPYKKIRRPKWPIDDSAPSL